MNTADFHKALADETRLKCLLLLLYKPELCVCEFTSALALSQPKISRHLGYLRKVGLLASRKQGLWVFYQLNPSLPSWAVEVLSIHKAQHRELVHEALLGLEQADSALERAQAGC